VLLSGRENKLSTKKLSPAAKALKRTLKKKPSKLAKIKVHAELVFDLHTEVKIGDLYGLQLTSRDSGKQFIVLAEVESVDPFRLGGYGCSRFNYETKYEVKKLGKLANQYLSPWLVYKDERQAKSAGRPDDGEESPSNFMEELGSMEE
jgi:hypothetical protein